MKINIRRHDTEQESELVRKIISELPEKFIAGNGEATAHLSQADGGTIKIYPSPLTDSLIWAVRIPEQDDSKLILATKGEVSFSYKGRRFLVSYS